VDRSQRPQDSQIRVVDLTRMKLDATDLVKLSIAGNEVIKPLVP
jgi:hypothetical protein